MTDYNSPEFWLDAPDWATHYLPAFEQYTHPIWLEMDGDTVLAAGHMGSDLRSFTYTKGIQPSTDVRRRIPRPAPQWSGDGLPPVGTVCELRHAPGGWGRATITHQGKGLTAWLWDHVNPDQVEYAECPDQLEFRPIRTDAQIAAEEREKAIDAMNKLVGDIEKIPTWRDALAALYDAGLRFTKQEKPE